ncbi:ribonuclease H, partial [Trifolium pratense]
MVITSGFWKFRWLGNQPFRDLYPNLFTKEVQPNVMIIDRISGFEWINHLSNSEIQQATNLSELLVGISLHPVNPDKWRWTPDSTGLFSVKPCYNVLLEKRHSEVLDPNLLTPIRQLWRNDIPSKVLCFGWRLLLKRLPTRTALNHRGQHVETIGGGVFNVMWRREMMKEFNMLKLHKGGRVALLHLRSQA